VDSEFLLWYEAQFGKRRITDEEAVRLSAQIYAAREAERRLDDDVNYRMKRDAALKAWCAAREVRG
jgi:hypothetical protein